MSASKSRSRGVSGTPECNSGGEGSSPSGYTDAEAEAKAELDLVKDGFLWPIDLFAQTGRALEPLPFVLVKELAERWVKDRSPEAMSKLNRAGWLPRLGKVTGQVEADVVDAIDAGRSGSPTITVI